VPVQAGEQYDESAAGLVTGRATGLAGGAANPGANPCAEPGEGPEALLADLDAEQQQVAVAPPGPVCVVAGAGTGKTRAVAYRVAYLAATAQADPARMLAVTFTTRAAGELRGRLRQLGHRVPDADLGRVQARTFHSAALRQLTHFWPSTVGGPAPQVLESKIGIVAEAARRLRISAGLAELRDAAGEIEWAKITQVRPADYPAASAKAARNPPLDPPTVARIFACYEELRTERHLVDFESVLELTAAVLAEYPVAARSVRARYTCFVVDEYQDVNPLQKLLLDVWLGGRDNICVVGDPRQTIYSFTGATPAYLTRFPAEFPTAPVIRLVRNYRSTPQVVTLANTIAAAAAPDRPASRAGVHDRLRAVVPGAVAPGGVVPGGVVAGGSSPAALVAQRPAGPVPQLTEYPDEPAEVAAVARQIRALTSAGLPAAEIAVLVRTNAQTQGLEQALAQAGVPFQLRGAERFFERDEVRQAVALLRAASRSAAAPDDPAAEIRPILASIGLTPQPPGGRGTARDRWESLEALAQLAADFFAANPAAGLPELAAELAVRGDLGHAPAMGGVTLASLHSAKGLEWRAVFLPGLTDGTVPIVYAQTDEAIEEERRLLYVGITRARERLCLSWALARVPGGRRTRAPSRFLTGLLTGRPERGGSAASARRGKRAPTGLADPASGQPGADDPLFRRLREWRLGIAREQSVPAYVVFSDATLQAIAATRPGTRAELAGVPGVGVVKLDRYGPAVLELCAADTAGGPLQAGEGTASRRLGQPAGGPAGGGPAGGGPAGGGPAGGGPAGGGSAGGGSAGGGPGQHAGRPAGDGGPMPAGPRAPS
jgi:DNA helicase II / ATP-dependent DNA helicase PcrA